MGNINLGKLPAPPSYQDMQFLMEQAARYRGRFVEVSWSVPKTDIAFQLTAKFVPSQSQPTWMLYRGAGADSELIWGHTSNDLTLMHNLVSLECEKAPDSNSVSESSMNSLLSGNRNAGALAGAVPESAGVKRTTAEVVKPTTPTGFAEALSPADTWLKNLQSVDPQAAPPTGNTRPEVKPSPAMEDGRHVIASGGTQELAALSAASLDGSLDGNLVNITVPKLLSYLVQKEATGRLSLKSSANACDVYCRNGQLVHAVSLDARGEFALLDAATWMDGEFAFKPQETTTQQSLGMSSGDFVVAAQGMLDYSRFLSQYKLHSGAYLTRAKTLTRDQFIRQVQEYGLVDPHQLWRIYEVMDGNRTISDILRFNPMTRAEWIPAIYTLLKAQLVVPSETPKDARPGMFLEGAPVDQTSIDKFLLAMSDPEDLALRRQAFLYFLQQEQFRYDRSGAQFALAIFSLATTRKLDTNAVPFSKEMMRTAVERILKAKRKLDVVGHFDNEYALLLPETDSAGAAVFANRICDLLTRPPINAELADQTLVASFGIASIPHDVRDLSGLLAAARAAKAKSKMMGAPVCVYGDA